MAVSAGNSREIFAPLRCKARARRGRALFWAVAWALLANMSLLAFKAAQIRIQPDAVATGLPGFLFRLVILPMGWLMRAADSAGPLPPALQISLWVAICATLIGMSRHLAGSLGEERFAVNRSRRAPLPGRRVTTCN